jgi:5-methylcytosine-specific restriction endonuclease McrA
MPIDYKLYPKNWQELRKKVLIRANNACELCPAVNYQKHWKTGSKVILTIHHINFDITDSRMCNLIALCQRCHIKLDAGEKSRRRGLKKNGGNKLI